MYASSDGQSFSALLKVYAPSSSILLGSEWTSPNYAPFLALKNLGFDIVDTPEEADVIVLESTKLGQLILGRKSNHCSGGSAMQRFLEKPRSRWI